MFDPDPPAPQPKPSRTAATRARPKDRLFVAARLNPKQNRPRSRQRDPAQSLTSSSLPAVSIEGWRLKPLIGASGWIWPRCLLAPLDAFFKTCRSGPSISHMEKGTAWAVIGGRAKTTPKSCDGSAESLRALTVARDGAVKGRTEAGNAIKALLSDDLDLTGKCKGKSAKVIAAHRARLRPSRSADPVQARRPL